MGRRLLPFLLLLVPATASAFRADEKTPPEFGRLDRARVPDPLRQAELTASPEWGRFVATYGSQWRVTWDDRAGTPRSIIGATIALVSPDATAAEVEAASRAFLDSIGYLSRVSDAQLRTKVLTKANGAWYVRFDRVTRAGEEVAGAFAELRIVKGNVVLIRLETHPAAEAALPVAKLAQAEAISRANDALRGFVKPTASLTATAKRKIVAIPAGKTWAYRPAFEVESTGGRALRYRSVVDAVYGEVLSRESLVRYAVAGEIRGLVEARTVGDTPAAKGLPYVNANIGGAGVTADIAGVYSAAAAAAPATVNVGLSGSYITVINEAGAAFTQSFTASTATGNVHDLNAAGVSRDLAQLDAYVSANDAKRWAQTVTPGLSWLNQVLQVNVNINDECNAFWDGSTINFFDTGAQCNNTARIADVVYHEFGHGFHQNVAISGTIDGAVGEGTGDFLAATNTGSPQIGPNFMLSGDPVRDIEPNQVYPDDVIGQVHNDGLIWGGSMWDLRKGLIAKYGDAGGRAAVDGIFARALAAGPTLDQTYDEVILADDDDGNLGNGTPNQCEIDAAFGAHGLAGTSTFGLVHTEVTGPISGGQAIAVSASRPAALCAGSTVASASLRYKIDDGATQTVNLTLSGDDFSGEIPAVAAGSVVRYWFQGQLEDGTTVTTPPRAPENVYAFYVGPLFTVWKDDFEGADVWSSGGSGGDWEIGTPNGSSSDPATAYSGTMAFGNSVGDDGAYMANANNWAESPVIDCRGCSGARLQLRRWLTVEDASFDFARILVNGTQVYENPVGAGNGGALPKDPMWSFQDYDISSLADGEEFIIRFELESDGGVEYGGWTLDDVAIVTPGEPGDPGDGGGYGLFGCGCSLDARASTRSAAAPLALIALAFLPFLRRRGISHRTGA